MQDKDFGMQQMRAECPVQVVQGKLCHGSGTFDYGDWAVRL